MISLLFKISTVLSDRTYLFLMYIKHFRRIPNLIHPTKYNEKLQWLKLYDHNPAYVIMVDKYKVKDYVAKIIGEDYVIPTLGHWKTPEDIDFNSLPEKFVLKWNHDSGSVVICKDKKNFDVRNAVARLQKGKNVNGFWYGREWPYKHVDPIIVAEQYMEDTETKQLRDYKLFTFNGKVKLFLVVSDRQNNSSDTKFDFFDEKKNHLNIVNQHPNSEHCPKLPSKFDEMVMLAEKLAEGLPHIRVDFYEVNGKVYFGELTLYHGSGFMHFDPCEWDELMGSWIQLPPQMR